jgi:hypothetical protein
MLYAKTTWSILLGFTVAHGASSRRREAAVERSDALNARAVSAPGLPDPCGLVTDDEVSGLLWKGMENGQRQSLQAKKAKYVFTKRVENIETPPGRTCHFHYQLVAPDGVRGQGDFQLRTLAKETFDLFAQSKKSSQKPISGVGDQAFYLSNAAYGRRGNVGVEVVNFNSKDIEIELLKDAVARLP